MAALVTLFIIIVAILIALIPFFIANSREHKYKWIILVLCVFAPSGIAWIAALIWALWPQDTTIASPVVEDATGIKK